MRKILTLTAAIIAAGSIAFAIPASATSKPAPKQAPQAHAWEYQGTIRPVDNPHWCLTGAEDVNPTGPIPVFMLPCVKGFANQEWFAGRVLTIGQIGYIPIPQYRVSKRNLFTVNNVSLIDSTVPGNLKKYVDLLGFTPYHKGWLIDVKPGKNLLFMTTLSHLVFKKGHAVQPYWRTGTSKSSLTQEWIINWKPVKLWDQYK